MSVMAAIFLMAAGAPMQADATKAPAAEQKICRRTRVTGTRLREPKQCNTRAEWERIDAAARDQSNSAQVRSRPTG